MAVPRRVSRIAPALLLALTGLASAVSAQTFPECDRSAQRA